VADYQARIQLLVSGQNALRDLETRINSIETGITNIERRWRTASAALQRSSNLLNVTGRDAPRGAGGRFAADPDRRQRLNALALERSAALEQRLARLSLSRTQREATAINERLSAQNRLNRRIENQISLESRLNAAVDLYQTNARKFQRGGGGAGAANLREQAQNIQNAFAAFEAGGSRNLRLIRSLGTELGRVVQAQNELNRASSLGSKGFEAGRRLQERLTVVAERGVTTSGQIRGARSMATQAIAASRTGDQQAYSEAIRRATAATARLERESLETSRALDAQQREIARYARLGGATSPVRGAANIPGSPVALEQQNRQRQRQRQTLFRRAGGALSGGVIGGAFPLLFGQSGGAALGGAIGGVAGGLLGPGGSFAGSLFGTLLGDIASKGNVVKKLGEDIGFSAEQTRILEGAFKQAGSEFDKFEASVQNIRGLGLDIENQANAIRLVSTLTEKYGGQIDKVTNAYTSALESGRVTQATLNQLTSQGIPIQQALADKYKVSRSEILQMAKDGKISVQELSDTLVNLGNQGVNATEKTRTGFDNLAAATGNLGTALSNLGTIIVTSLQGPLDWLSNRLASIIDAAARGIGRISDLLAGGQKAQASIQASSQAQTLTRNKFGARALNPFDKDVQAFRTAQEKDIYRRLTGTKLGPGPSEARTPIGRITVPGQLPPSGGVGRSNGKSDAEKAAEEALREAERVKEVIRNRLAEGQVLRLNAEIQDKIAAAEIDGDKMLAARLTGAQRELDIQYKYAQELANEKNIDAQRAIIFEGQTALAANQLQTQRELNELQRQNDQDRLTSLQKAIEKQYELNTAVQNQIQLADGVANTLGQGLGSVFDVLISGAKGWEDSLRQIASGVLIDIANQLIRIFVIEQAINAIKTFLTPFSPSTPLGAGGGTIGKFGTLGPNYGIPQRAKGGPVSGGQMYMVGERGPELFVPGRSGTIVPNDKMGGGSTNVVVNVDAKGSSVEGNDQGANQLGRVISAAVQSELIKQQRPGGLLAR
jgi:tape measure domain-containing protein